MMTFRRLAAALSLGLLATAVPALAHADDVDLGGTTDVVGLAWDEGAETLYVSAAGTPEAVQMVGRDGTAAGEITFTGGPQSVQGLALDDGQLHIADIGDPDADREFVTVFAVAPEAGQQSYRAWDFAYPDGAQDATAFLISGRGRFYFITTGDDAGIYGAELEPSRQGVNTLFRAADAPEGVTDAAFLDDGETMLVRTGDGVELINAFTWEVESSTTYVGGAEGESVTPFGADRMLVGAGGTLRDEPLPAGQTTATPAAPTTSPEPSETAETSADPSVAPSPTGTAAPAQPADSSSDSVSRGGTLIALAGALVVALAAGAVVFFSKD
ncbi:hypothetical protein FOJ82_04330 [Tessaracoccus rhinocerotis]|uniref:WD40 repeat domain-containing protein n=1 Tax=Tessaracoccus rhinocerotis TaxID=1689449 RepID=A0A553K5W3_9ACTN|nr:hypothetical protein [Tessaracoccus rhinocerotis]TRY20099.1 hypothetical protein FOJ82_04330 [Tessaracoccus rhinocerotis]